MRDLYLDTNIYIDIEQAGLAAEVRSLLDTLDSSVTASVVSLVELANLRNREQALRQVKTLTTIARAIESPLFTDLTSQELLHEVRRLRPRSVQSSRT